MMQQVRRQPAYGFYELFGTERGYSVRSVVHQTQQGTDQPDVVDQAPADNHSKTVRGQIAYYLTALLQGLKVVSGFTHIRNAKRVLKGPKVAMSRNRTVAALRVSVHIIPMAVALGEVILNWQEYFVGPDFWWSTWIQFAAQVHALLMHTSLAAIMLTYLRHEIVLKHGLPFGALFAGLQLTSISYLWSMEFHASLDARFPFRKRVTLVLMVVLCFTLAIVSNPSTAILMIPRVEYYSMQPFNKRYPAYLLTMGSEIASTPIWINTTSNELWPLVVNSSLLHDPTACSTGSDADQMLHCPSAEWQLIQRSMGLPQQNKSVTMEDNEATSHILQDMGSSHQFDSIRMHGQLSAWPLLRGMPEVGNSSFAEGKMSAVTDALQGLASVWPGRSSWFGALQLVHSLHDRYFEPFVVSRCVLDVLNGSNLTAPVSISPPPIQGDYYADPMQAPAREYYQDGPALILPDVNRSEIWKTLRDNSQNNVFWFDVPWTPAFANVSIATVIFDPLEPAASPQKPMMVCSITGGWSLSRLNATAVPQQNSLASYSSSINFDGVLVSRKYLIPSLDPSDWVSLRLRYPESLFLHNVTKISSDWAVLLNPIITPVNISLFNLLLAQYPTQKFYIGQTMLPVMVANGLSRMAPKSTLVGRMVQSEPEHDWENTTRSYCSGKAPLLTAPPDSTDFVQFQVDTQAQGYLYHLSGAAHKLASVAMLVYFALALCHIFYATVSGISSSAWDTLGELASLAMQSSPADTLKHTGAGVKRTDIFKRIVRVMARTTPGEDEHLELVYADGIDKDESMHIIQLNKAYR